MHDVAIVGGGVGGVLSGSLLAHAGLDVILLEALDYLGGCSGTFAHREGVFNAGATTLVGLDDRLPVGRIARVLGIKLPVRPVDPAIRVHLPQTTVPLLRNRDAFLEALEHSFPHIDHALLWSSVFRTADALWPALSSLPVFPPNNPGESLRSLVWAMRLLSGTGLSVLGRASNHIHSVTTDPVYQQFLDHLLLITTQATSGEVTFLPAALGLSYATLDNHVALGGMSAALDALAKPIPRILRRTRVRRILPKNDRYILQTSRGEIEARKVVLNRDIWSLGELVDAEPVRLAAQKAMHRVPRRWGAVTLYFMVQLPPDRTPDLHHQIHHEKNPWTGSHSLFLSLSDPSDERLSPEGWRSVTVSTHTEPALWEGLEPALYAEQKERVRTFMLDQICAHLPEFRHAAKGGILVGTPRTFRRFTGRTEGSVGGVPMTQGQFPFGFASCRTPLKGLYQVGDTVFPGQGWPGVATGVLNLMKVLEKDSVLPKDARKLLQGVF
ncbi:phytoene desaturase family protein [Leptospirillum ferriphilum]|uniref:phytoene desaturase family protein n=1 Tax=Leptospirillum ferriphilum TaxID=178606 RepID=UPI0006B19839|nr:FAD-dependent oxidoreductase [Leptospirillum ferriphilum]